MQWSDRIGRRLKPRDLHVFMAVAEHRSMAAAAEHLAVSRPVVSKTISDLEAMLGVPLFDRLPSGVELTGYGHALLKRSAVVFDDLRQSVEELEFMADHSIGHLRVGSNESTTAGLMTAALARVLTQYPGWSIRSVIAPFAAQADALRQRSVELVLGRHMVDEPDVAVEPLFHDRLVVVTGAKSVWARRRKIALADLVGAEWIQSPSETSPGGPTYEAFTDLGLPVPPIKIFSELLNLRYGLLAQNKCVTMIPESVFRFSPIRTFIKVLPINIPPWRRPMAIQTLKNRTLSSQGRLFVDIVRKIAAPLARGR